VLSPIDFDINEVAPQKDYNFGKCKLATASYGHGIATTILKLAKGYAILSNGGYDIKPTLILKKNDNSKSARILNSGVSDQVVTVLRKIVNTEEGTAKFANVPNYEIGGKTGTADKVLNGIYSDDAKVNTFASIFPTSNPQFVFIVMLDAPIKSKDYYDKYRHRKAGWTGKLNNSAGWTSVEVTGKIMDKIGPILATKYLEIN